MDPIIRYVCWSGYDEACRGREDGEHQGGHGGIPGEPGGMTLIFMVIPRFQGIRKHGATKRRHGRRKTKEEMIAIVRSGWREGLFRSHQSRDQVP